MPPLNLNELRQQDSLLEDQPGADVTSDGGPRLPQDGLGRRLGWAGGVSLVVNIVLWSMIAQQVRNHVVPPLPPITFKQIILAPPKPPKKIVPKLLPPKPKPIVKPKPILKPKPLLKPPPLLHPIQHAPPPPAAHHAILTAKGPTVAANTALPGGHAQLGAPIAHQNLGEGSDNNALPTPQAPPQPQPVEKPQPAPPPAPTPAPKPAPPPQPAGPTQDAQPSHQTLPDIPDELKTGDYKSSVRVKVDIAADGSFTVSLLTSSGNLEIDRRVTDALKHWKWKPALQEGQAVESTQRFRFNFEVE